MEFAHARFSSFFLNNILGNFRAKLYEFNVIYCEQFSPNIKSQAYKIWTSPTIFPAFLQKSKLIAQADEF